MAKRLIDAETLWQRLDAEPWYNNADRDEVALPLVDDAPTVDAVEVVRCKDCVFYRDTKDWYGSAYKACHLRTDVIIQKRNQDDFCSRGERRCE